jgi:hypothetical protein
MQQEAAQEFVGQLSSSHALSKLLVAGLLCSRFLEPRFRPTSGWPTMQTLSPPGLYYDVPAARRYHATQRIGPFTLFLGGILRPLLKAEEN